MTHVPRDSFTAYVHFLHEIAANLRSQPPGHQIRYALMDSDPQLAGKPSSDRPRLCYSWDRRMVEASDLVIAEVSYPSLGLGIELQIAEQKGIPIILAFRKSSTNKADPAIYRNPDSTEHNLQIGEGYVSIMALGIPNVICVISYESFEDAIPVIIRAVEALNPS